MPFTSPAQKKAVMEMLVKGDSPPASGARRSSSVDPRLIEQLVGVFSQLDPEAMAEFVSALEQENPDAVISLADAVAATFQDSEDSSDESDSSDEEE